MTAPTHTDTIPAELRARPQWVAWRSEIRQGKPTKVPYQTNGKKASSTDPRTWTTFEEAVRYAEVAGVDGIGFVFSSDDPYIGIDLDEVRDLATGEMEEWARALLERLDSYTELSPSGTGTHTIVRGKLPGTRRRIGHFEWYETGRFFTVTGNIWPPTAWSIIAHFKSLDEIAAEIFPPQSPGGKDHEPGESPWTDQILIDRLLASSETFQQLYGGGDITGYNAAHGIPQGQNEADLALVNVILRANRCDVEQADRIFRTSPLMRAKWDERHGPATYGELTLARALTNREPQMRGQSERRNGQAHQTEESRPYIDVTVQNLPALGTQVWAALQAANVEQPRLFRRAGQLMRLVPTEHEDLVLQELTADRLRHEMARAATCYRVSPKGDKRVVAPPSVVVTDVLAYADPPLPRLDNIVPVPVFGPDGTLLTEPGYHPQAFVYIVLPRGLALRAVATAPTVTDVIEAKALLFDELLVDFPFVTQADRAHAACLFLLPFVRYLIDGPTPGHLIEAPLAGNGKGLLVSATLGAAYGDRIGIVGEARDDAEMGKRILAQLYAGHGAITIDNLSRSLESPTFAAVLTAWPTWEDRVLGRTEMLRVPNRAVWALTANNITMSTEMARRLIRSRMDAGVDQPWQRSAFRHLDLRDWARQHRTDLIWAAHTLVRNWQAQGSSPYQGQSLGSFENWTRILGGILEANEIEGFLGNLDAFYEASDTEGAVWREFVDRWWGKFTDTTVGTADLFPLAVNLPEMDLGNGSEVSQRATFGKLLAKQKDRVIGDYQVTSVGTRHRLARWRLTKIRETV